MNGMFWTQPMVGSGQYLYGLLDALLRLAPEHRYTLLVPDLPDIQQALFPMGNAACSVVMIHTPFDRRNRNLAKLWFEQVGVPLGAARLGVDLLHVPYFAPPLCSRVPVVASVLDIIPLVLPEYRGSAFVRAYMRLVTQAARRAVHVIAISEASRQDITRELMLPPERVTVTPLAVGSHIRPVERGLALAQVAERYGISEPFIYYVGGLDARKNVPVLIRAFGRLRRSGGPPATLVIAGRALGSDPVLFPDLDALIAKEGLQDWVKRVNVPVADNALLFSAASVFAFPSRYEGFGLPALEALACGTPTIVAEASSLPEVVGDAALRVPPDDIPAWTAALWRLLGDPGLRAQLRERGLARAASFLYEQTAQLTLEVYAHAARRDLSP